MSSRKRSVFKAFTWRVVALIITICVAYIVTGEVHVAVGVAAIDSIIKVVAYYLHERTWDRFGRNW